MVVRQHQHDFEPEPSSCARIADLRARSRSLLGARQQRLAVVESVSQILSMCQLQAIGAELAPERKEVRHSIDVARVQDDVDGERDTELHGPGCDRALVCEEVFSADLLRSFWHDVLERKLQPIQAGSFQGLEALELERDAARDQDYEELEFAGACHDLHQVLAEQRLAPR